MKKISIIVTVLLLFAAISCAPKRTRQKRTRIIKGTVDKVTECGESKIVYVDSVAVTISTRVTIRSADTIEVECTTFNGNSPHIRLISINGYEVIGDAY